MNFVDEFWYEHSKYGACDTAFHALQMLVSAYERQKPFSASATSAWQIHTTAENLARSDCYELYFKGVGIENIDFQGVANVFVVERLMHMNGTFGSSRQYYDPIYSVLLKNLAVSALDRDGIELAKYAIDEFEIYCESQNLQCDFVDGWRLDMANVREALPSFYFDQFPD